MMKKSIVSLLILCCLSPAAFAQHRSLNPDGEWKKIAARISSLYNSDKGGAHAKKWSKMPYEVNLVEWNDSVGKYKDTIQKFQITRKADGTTPAQLTLYTYDSTIPSQKIVVDSFVNIPGGAAFNGFEFMGDWLLARATMYREEDSVWVVQERVTITHTSRGMERILYEEWTGSAWVNETMEQYLFDSLDIATGFLIQEWKNGGWVNSFGYRIVFTYDGEGNPVRADYFIMEEDSTEWEPEEYWEVYTLNANGEISSALRYYGPGVNSDRDSIGGMEWQNFQKGERGPLAAGGWAYSSYSIYEWDSANNVWSPWRKESKTYTNGLETEDMRQIWDTVLASWQNYTRTTTDYDSHGEKKEILYFTWGNTAWKPDGGTRLTNTYDGDNDILEQKEEYLYDSTWTKAYKTTYRYTDPSGFADSKALPLVKFYPNPVSDYIIIELPDRNETFLLKITDLNGRVISARQVNGQFTSMDLSGLRAGPYVLSLESGKAIYTSRFIRR